MGLTRINAGTNEDGTTRWHYVADEGSHVVYTGPYISGTVTLKDGTEVDVSPLMVEAKSEKHAKDIAHAIGERHAAEGHPAHTDGTAFVHDTGKRG